MPPGAWSAAQYRPPKTFSTWNHGDVEGPPGLVSVEYFRSTAPRALHQAAHDALPVAVSPGAGDASPDRVST